MIHHLLLMVHILVQMLYATDLKFLGPYDRRSNSVFPMRGRTKTDVLGELFKV